jgi:O-antigen/teichoic acid export membrane protein
MGVIKRQGIKQSIVGYAGIGIGLLSTLFVYAQEEAIYGLALFLTNTAAFIAPLMSVGLQSIVVRFFPEFKTKDKTHSGFFGFLQLSLLLVFTAMLLLGVLAEEWVYWLMGLLNMKTELIASNILPLVTLTFFVLQISILREYISNFYRIVVPAIIAELWFKIALPAIVLLFHFGLLQAQGFIWSIIFYHALAWAGLLFYLYQLGGLHFRIRRQAFPVKRLKKMGEYALFGVLGMLGNVLAFRIDLFMVPTMLGLATTGIYGIAQFIGRSIETPRRALFGITRPILSQAMKAGRLEEVEMLYKKTSLNLSIVGLLLLVLVMGSLDDLLRLTKNYQALSTGVQVVLLTGLTKLVDMASSANGLIIYYSKYYRFNFYTVVLLAISNVSLNLYLIPKLGINGAALATLLSMTLSNAVRMAFVWIKWRMQPFSWPHLTLLGIGAIAYAIGWLLPSGWAHPVFTIALRSLLIAAAFVPAMLYLRLSADINELALDAWNQLRKRLP